MKALDAAILTVALLALPAAKAGETAVAPEASAPAQSVPAESGPVQPPPVPGPASTPSAATPSAAASPVAAPAERARPARPRRAQTRASPKKPADDLSTIRNPVIEAINLVASTQKNEIREADRKVAESDWWVDTMERDWIVKRPFGPGIFDSTQWFYVSYKVNGRILMSWFVDLGKGTVAAVAPPEHQSARQ